MEKRTFLNVKSTIYDEDEVETERVYLLNLMKESSKQEMVNSKASSAKRLISTDFSISIIEKPLKHSL